jgi:hypothetical protein
MQIDASRPAVDYIQRRGGHLFVWFGRMRDGSMFSHVRTEQPSGRVFDSHLGPDGIRVWFEREAGVEPVEIRIRRRPWPLGPIEVTWDGGPGGLRAPSDGMVFFGL